jgi:integrase/recombinase XerD
VPAQIADAGARALRRFVQFFTANIRNKNMREAYGPPINAFLAWCNDEAAMGLDMIEPWSSPLPMSRSCSRTVCRNPLSSST